MTLQDLFTSPDKWTQGAYARDASGYSVSPISRRAVAWCLNGALAKCYGDYDNGHTRYYEVATRIKQAIEPQYRIAHWNDTKGRTFEEVCELVKTLDL